MRSSHHAYDAVKRVLDVVGAVIALVILSPLLAVVALLVLVRMGSPILFRQQRSGIGGRPFTIYKFRTMRQPQPDTDAEMAVASDAERLTPLGRRLRASSIDELPEFFNVLRGDMSIVGPRPLLPQYLERYNEQQVRRLEVRPGITGWAQVNGRNTTSWDDRLALDVHYIENRSLAFDAHIVLMTPRAVLSGKGVSAEGSATMPPFRPGSAGTGPEKPTRTGGTS